MAGWGDAVRGGGGVSDIRNVGDVLYREVAKESLIYISTP